MSELILFPDPLTVLGRYFTEQLEARGHPATVSSKAPSEIPRTGPAAPSYVRLDVMDRNRTGLVTEDVTLAIEAYADGTTASTNLAGLLRAIAWASPDADSPAVLAVRELSGPSPLPDPGTGLTRTTQTVVFAMRGAAV